MKCYFFLTQHHNSSDTIEDIINDIYAFTSSKSMYNAFRESRNMKLFYTIKLSLDKEDKKMLYEYQSSAELIKLPVHPKDKTVYNKYDDIMLIVTKHESFKIKEEALKQIQNLSWNFDDDLGLLTFKDDIICYLSDLKYDRAVNYQFEDLISEKKISGDYVNLLIKLFGYTLR